MERSLQYRINRLERAFLSFAYLISGEAAASMSPAELQVLQAQMAKDMKEIADDFH